MVSFTEIAKAIMENSEKEFTVESCIPKHESSVSMYKIERTSSDISNKNPFEKIAVRNHVSKVSSQSQSQSQPTPALRVSVVPILASPSADDDSGSEPDLEPVPFISIKPLAAVAVQAPTAVHMKIPTKPKYQEVSERGKRPQDPICFGISIRDPMYEIASVSVKQSIEAEEARLLESKIADLYKSESGRSRGWTKKSLESFFQSRSATGGFLPSKQVFVWTSVFTDKQASALLDYVCIAKGIRLAVWNQAEKCIGIWPAADLSTSKQIPPLFHASTDGVALSKTSVFENGWKLRAALSVEHGLEKLSIDELDSIAEKMGITEYMTGKKTDRLRTLAQIRTEQRLQTSV